MKKALQTIVTVLLLASVSVLPAMADYDIDYSGPLDDVTGEPTQENQVVEKTTRVALGKNFYYDRNDRDFFYEVASGIEIHSNIVDGMVTTDAVEIDAPNVVDVELYCNGEQVEDVNLSMIKEPGNYVLNVLHGTSTTQPLHFTIVNRITGVLDSYRMPNQFAVTKVLLDGETRRFSTNEVDLSQEGKYQITYCCQPTGVSYHLDIQVDHTAPELKLESVVNGIARGPVDLSDAGKDDTLTIMLDGKTIKKTDKLTQSGTYKVSIQDEAGNSNTYNFRIQVYFNWNSMVFAVLLVAVVVAVSAYLLWSRKRLRVR